MSRKQIMINVDEKKQFITDVQYGVLLAIATSNRSTVEWDREADEDERPRCWEIKGGKYTGDFTWLNTKTVLSLIKRGFIRPVDGGPRMEMTHLGGIVFVQVSRKCECKRKPRRVVTRSVL